MSRTVKPEYIETATGKIPSDWTFGKIENVCDILDSRRVPINSNERSKIKGKIPYYGANGVVDYINKYLFNEDLILLAEDGGNFDQYQTRPIAYQISGKSWVNNHAHILRAKLGINQNWVFYALVHKNITQYVNPGTRSKLNQGDLRKIPIPLPPLPEQYKIAAILSSVDHAIQATKKVIEKTKRLKQGLMQQLLTKGIPGWHTEFKEVKIGYIKLDIPKKWKFKKLVYTADSFVGGPFGSDLKVEHYTSKGVRVIQLQNIGEGEFYDENKVFTSEKKYEDLIKCSAISGDIIIAKMADPVARACILPENNGQKKWLLASDAIRLRVCKDNNAKFVMYMINSPLIRKIAESRSTGTTRLRIGLVELRNLPFLIPPLEEQIMISDILGSVDNKIDFLKLEIMNLVKLKKSLMQNLLTGKIRVKTNE